MTDEEWLKSTFGGNRAVDPDPYPYGAPSPDVAPVAPGRCAAIIAEWGRFYRQCGNGAGVIEITQSGSVLFLCDVHKQKTEDILNTSLHDQIAYLQASLAGKKPPRSRKDTRREHVYFLRRSDGAIKIGRSIHVEYRKRDLESAAGPLDLLGTLPGGEGVGIHAA